jgi:RNA polymerase sigma factor (sigma-70 family)
VPTTGDQVTADAAAFEELFYGNADRLVRLAHLLGASDPEDAVQEAFCKLYASRRTSKVDNIVAYLNRMVVNEVRSRQRHLAVVRRKQLHPVNEPSPIEHIEAAEARSELLAALANIAPRQREALVLRFWLDLSLREIADVMGLRLGTVKSLVSRGMDRLALDLEDNR